LKKRHFPDDIQEIQERFCKPLDSAFESFRDETIEKWNSKLQVSIPVQKKFKVINQSIVSQINTVLRDQARLISRTQLKRTDYQIIGKEEVSVQADGKVDSHLNNHDPLIFDDGDFYQQLLKELIDSRVKDSKDPLIVDSNLKVLASLQAKRFKKIVDTRASKGRKVRYQVHPKLENFMTSEPRGSWHDEMTQELYSSIFGENGSKEENKEVTVTEGFKLMA
jgi:protein AATF/BFR2